ncbi:MAG: hypothetical protein ACE5OS_01500 [Anaerolineae bacterium]
MKRAWVWLILPVVMAGLLVACGHPEGEKLLQERCTVCHSLDRVKQAHRTSEEWNRIVTLMVGRGAELEEDEQAVLVDYLVETYGP